MKITKKPDHGFVTPVTFYFAPLSAWFSLEKLLLYKLCNGSHIHSEIVEIQHVKMD